MKFIKYAIFFFCVVSTCILFMSVSAWITGNTSDDVITYKQTLTHDELMERLSTSEWTFDKDAKYWVEHDIRVIKNPSDRFLLWDVTMDTLVKNRLHRVKD